MLPAVGHNSLGVQGVDCGLDGTSDHITAPCQHDSALPQVLTPALCSLCRRCAGVQRCLSGAQLLRHLLLCYLQLCPQLVGGSLRCVSDRAAAMRTARQESLLAALR